MAKKGGSGTDLGALQMELLGPESVTKLGKCTNRLGSQLGTFVNTVQKRI